MQIFCVIYVNTKNSFVQKWKLQIEMQQKSLSFVLPRLISYIFQFFVICKQVLVVFELENEQNVPDIFLIKVGRQCKNFIKFDRQFAFINIPTS